MSEVERSWEDLPGDLLYDIFSRVFVDHHHLVFPLVCKSWKSILQSHSPTKRNIELCITESCYPYLFFTNDNLINPMLDKVHELDFFPKRTLGVQLGTVNEHWLLFSQNLCEGKPSKAFFFNPFTQAIIWIPSALDDEPHSMWFTSSPTSDAWKVVAVRSYNRHTDSVIWIETIKCGEEKWTSCDFELKKYSFECAFCNPCLYKGKYYIFGKNSVLLIHDPEEDTLLLYDPPESLCWLRGEQYMVESEGKLLAVLVNIDGSSVIVCEWDVIKLKWVTLESLGNNVLFVSRPYSVSEKVSAGGMANLIYFPRLMNNRCLFYSLETKRLHISDGSSFTSFDGSKFAFSSTWIKPPTSS